MRKRIGSPGIQFTPEQIVGVRIDIDETTFQQALQEAGGIWNRHRKVWEVRYDKVLDLQLEERIILDNECVFSADGISGDV
ncbi:MAG: hypothetical protein GY801_25480 [bacterium]|nr:hypothetical protein [bacterium]